MYFITKLVTTCHVFPQSKMIIHHICAFDYNCPRGSSRCSSGRSSSECDATSKSSECTTHVLIQHFLQMSGDLQKHMSSLCEHQVDVFQRSTHFAVTPVSHGTHTIFPSCMKKSTRHDQRHRNPRWFDWCRAPASANLNQKRKIGGALEKGPSSTHLDPRNDFGHVSGPNFVGSFRAALPALPVWNFLLLGSCPSNAHICTTTALRSCWLAEKLHLKVSAPRAHL